MNGKESHLPQDNPSQPTMRSHVREKEGSIQIEGLKPQDPRWPQRYSQRANRHEPPPATNGVFPGTGPFRGSTHLNRKGQTFPILLQTRHFYLKYSQGMDK